MHCGPSPQGQTAHAAENSERRQHVLDRMPPAYVESRFETCRSPRECCQLCCRRENTFSYSYHQVPSSICLESLEWLVGSSWWPPAPSNGMFCPDPTPFPLGSRRRSGQVRQLCNTISAHVRVCGVAVSKSELVVCSPGLCVRSGACTARKSCALGICPWASCMYSNS